MFFSIFFCKLSYSHLIFILLSYNKIFQEYLDNIFL
jgi:hypothetical protein